MLRLLAFLWSGCWHKWETINSGPVAVYENGHRIHHDGRFWEERCQRCGVNRFRKQL